MITGIIVSGALALLFIYVRVTKERLLGLIAKAVASLAFVAMAVAAVATRELHGGLVLVVLGAVCGLVGDILLDLKRLSPEYNDACLYSGMTVFGIGHVIYFVALTMYAVSFSIELTTPLIVAAAAGAVIAFVSVAGAKPLGLKYGKFVLPSLIYAFLLGFMVVYTLFLGFSSKYMYVMFAGMLLFLASDLVLSKQYFGGKADDKALTIVNHILYYAAQIAIMAALFKLPMLG